MASRQRSTLPWLLWGFLLACVSALSDGAHAASTSEYSAADTSSPRATLRSFIDGCNELHQIIETEKFLDRTDARHRPLALHILDCINTSELPAFAREERAAEVAVCIKEILDRHNLPAWDEIPDSAAIEAAGGFEKLSRWRIPGTRITIARVDEGAQKHEYLFSSGTTSRAIQYFHDVEARPYRTTGPTTSPGLRRWYMSAPGHPFVASIVNRLPERVRFRQTFGLTNWKWPGLLLDLVLGIVLMLLLFRVYFHWMPRLRGKRPILSCLLLVFPVGAFFVPFIVEHVAHRYLSVRGNPLYFVGFFGNAIATFIAMVVAFLACTTIAETIIASPRVNSRGLNAQLIRIASKMVAVALAVGIFLFGGQYLGINVGTLLASAGIGGIALALGAQDTLKTLFGTVMLMADKPFRVGERIVFKGYDGVVEDIGLRSTRIRLLTNNQVSVPNDELARSDIENVGRRNCIRRVTDFHIPLNTPCEKTEMAVAIIRKELEAHEGMHPDYPPRVFFLDFHPDAFVIRVFYWFHPPDYWDFLAFGEKFNFAVCRAFDEHGIQFALPQRITPTTLESDPSPVEVRMVEKTPKSDVPNQSSN